MVWVMMLIDNKRKKDGNRGEGNMLKWKKALRISRMFLLFLIVAVLIPEDVLITATKAQTVVDTQQGTEDELLEDDAKSDKEEGELQEEEEDTTEPEPEPVLKGLVRNEKGDLYFYKDGEKLRNSWKTVNGNKYYFGKSGKAYTGKKEIGKATYFFADSGKRKTGWKTIHKKKYYFSPKNGKMVTGRKTISHYLCVFDEKGVLTRKIDKNKKMVALTYDDGPSIYTLRVLTTLKKNDAVATFFVVGNRVPTYSDTVKKAYDMGCEIGNHTYEHKSLPRLSEAGVKEQMSRTDEAVKKVTGQTTVIMRPTGGATNENVKKWVGKPSIIWSIDTLDWKTRNADSTKRAVLNHVKDGDVVLMHDLYSATASASETIIPELVKRGYQLVTVSELAECRGGMKETGAYFSFRK